MLQPAELLYRSVRCKAVSYNSSNEPYDVPGYNDVEQPFSSQQGSDLRQLRVAVDGGGSCQWQLKSLRVSFRIAADNPLAKGKEVINTSYIFDFGKYGLSDGYGTGKAIAFSGESLDLNAEFFPILFINHMFNKTTLKLFAGDTNYRKWSRRYRLTDISHIHINPLVSLNKLVRIESPEHPPGNLIATYPDGSREEIPDISPDYDRLLSLKSQASARN